MPISSFLFYIKAKHIEKIQWQNYVADCLWIRAVGKTFSNNNKPSYPRWGDISRKSSESKKTITKEDVKNQFRRLKE